MCQECQEIEVGYSESSEAWDQTVEYGSEEKVLNSGIKEEVSGKVCTKCGEWKPLTEFNIRSASKDGYSVWCKSCIQKYNKWYKSEEYVSVRPEKLTAPGKKQCATCFELLLVSEFHKTKGTKDGWAYECKKCRKARAHSRNSKLTFVADPCSTKICCDCGKLKGASEFYKTKAHADGLESFCKECSLIRKRERNSRINFEPNLSVIKACTKCGVMKGARDYYPCRLLTDGLESTCIECNKEKWRLRAEGADFKPDPNGTKVCRDCKELKNSLDFPFCRTTTDGLYSYCRVCTNRRNAESRKSNVDLKLRAIVRSRFSRFLKQAGLVGVVDKEAAVEFMGCTPDELAAYLENLFYNNPETGEEMMWSNHARKGWHIDHIIPLSKVDLTDSRQLKRVCHYSNLRPMWGKENNKKSAKLPKNWDKEAWLREIENE